VKTNKQWSVPIGKKDLGSITAGIWYGDVCLTIVSNKQSGIQHVILRDIDDIKALQSVCNDLIDDYVSVS
jgi:hypothetical protein